VDVYGKFWQLVKTPFQVLIFNVLALSLIGMTNDIIIWIAVAILMAFVMLILLRSLVGAKNGLVQPNTDIKFYNAQIAEIELQQKQQLISCVDAETAKAESARALIKAQPIETQINFSQMSIRVAALAILISIPAISLPIYAFIGRPQMPDLPLETRAKPDPAKAKLEEIIAQIEAKLSANPNDTRGLELIMPLYMRANRFDDAARVLQELIAKLGSTPTRETDLGEALMMANEGSISVESYAAFERALKIDPKFNKARYYIGKAAAQDGAMERARKIWSELAVDMPQGPLKTMVEDEIQKLNTKQQPVEKTLKP
jgi:cytochrome c-type biogenesis protein CcmH